MSAYIPAIARGAKIFSGNVKMSKVSGTIANSGVVYAVAHGLGKVPGAIVLIPKGTVGQLKAAAASANSVGLATVSAATSTNFYVAGAKNTHFDAVCYL